MDLTRLPTFRVAACDLNGQMRGKRVPGAYATKLDAGAVRMPYSTLNVDLFGADITDSPLVFDTGDADALLIPSERGPVPMPWLQGEAWLVPMVMRHEDGRGFDGDPRNALSEVLARYDARGWQVMAATEMEFTLIDPDGDSPAPPHDPVSNRRLEHEAVLSLTELDAFDGFFTALYTGCAAMGLPAQTATSESGIGQFEVTLHHQDALRAADDAWLFKSLVRGLARAHGFAATFMAKPYLDDAGNGMHVHFSVLDATGANVFDNGRGDGTPLLHHAVAGCLAAMPDSTLILAPHGNSYDRLVPGAHAPTAACWGHDNRTVALRIPGGAPAARRIEHRTAGADTNPYLVLACVLGAALCGIEDAATPPRPITGNAYDQDGVPQLAPDWASATDQIAQSAVLARILPPALIDNLVRTKRQEQARFAEIPPERHWLTLAETV